MTNLVTPKQSAFIATLLSERIVDTATRALAAQVRTTKEASFYIDNLMRQPRAPKAPAVAFKAADPTREEYYALLKDAEVSKYAIPTSMLAMLDLKIQGDLGFFEIRNYMGRRYLNRLVGAPGGFSRYRVNTRQGIAILKLAKNRHVEFARLFGQHYSVCGRCAAELTDQVSRETGFGPECRKVFGL